VEIELESGPKGINLKKKRKIPIRQLEGEVICNRESKAKDEK